MSEVRISSTELARSIGEILGRLRYGGETFIIERNGKPIAVLSPYPADGKRSLREIAREWIEADENDPGFADVLEDIGRADAPLEDPWESR